MIRSTHVKTSHDTQAVPLLDLNQSPAKAVIVIGAGHHRPCDSRPRLQRLLRAVGLGIVCQIINGKDTPEPKKTAICKDFWMAFFAGLIHLLPVLATTILIGLNCNGYYIGSELSGPSGYDDLKFIGLQFAAKLHELALNASLTAVVFSYIRHEMAMAGGLPFGAIFAGFQFRDLSFLWSPELRGAVCATFTRSRRKWSLISLVVVCALLAVSVGPFSATLMRPRLDYWAAGGTDFWIDIHQDELISANVTASQVPASCSMDTDDLSCPYADWETIVENYLAFWPSPRAAGYLPKGFYMPSAKSTRFMTTVTRSPYWQYAEQWTVATISSSSVADCLSETGRLWVLAASRDLVKGFWSKRRFWSRTDALFRTEAEQPIVQARCLQYNASDLNLSGAPGANQSLGFYDLSNELFNGSDFPTFLPGFPNNASIVSLQQKAISSSVPQLVWTNIAQKDISSPLAAVLSVPAKIQGDALGSQLYACTLDARMAPVLMEATGNAPLYVSGFPHGTYETDVGNYEFGGVETFKFGSLETYAYGNSWPKISIDHGWAEYLNPMSGSDNSTVISTILRMTGLWNSTRYINPNDSKYAVEAVLATTVVNGLARRDHGKGFAGHLLGHEDQLLDEGSQVSESSLFPTMCGEWCKAILPAYSKSMGYGSSAFNVSHFDQLNSTKFKMQASANGYAYSDKGSGQKFAITAHCFYLVIVVLHWIYVVKSMESSSSWDTIAELVALAISSTPSAVFTNTGAGIDSSRVFKSQTQVIDRDGHLELAFGVPSGRHEKVKPNEPYA